MFVDLVRVVTTFCIVLALCCGAYHVLLIMLDWYLDGQPSRAWKV
jgi:hypothetical protein